MRARARKFGSAVFYVYFFFICLFLFETVGQRFVFKNEMYYVDNVDHRLDPWLEPDLNQDRIRSKVESETFREEDVNIVFLGDSYVFGFGHTVDQAIPALLQEKANTLHRDARINVANFGWPTSSPLLSLRLLRDIGRKYSPDVVLLGLDMTDFHDDIKYFRLLERKGVYRALDFAPMTLLLIKKLAEFVPPLHEKLFRMPVRRFFVTDRPLDQTIHYLSYVRQSIDEIHSYARDELGAKFILFLFPRSYQYSDRESPENWERDEYEELGPYAHEPFRYFDQVREELSFPVYSLLPDFRDADVFPTTFYDDPHWTERGNAVAVEAIYQFCLQEGCFESPAEPGP